LTDTGSAEEIGEDAAFLKKTRTRIPLTFEAFARSVGVGNEVETRYTSSNGRVDTGLGAEFDFPYDESKPHAAAVVKKSEGGVTLHALLYGYSPDPLEAYFGGSMSIQGQALRGLRRSDVQQLLVDAVKEWVGTVRSDEPLPFGSTTGRLLEVWPIEAAGGYDPDDPPTLRLAFVAENGVLHFAGAINRSRKELQQSADVRQLFESMKATGKLGSPRLPKKTLLYAPP
jgi:hypothetical protein